MADIDLLTPGAITAAATAIAALGRWALRLWAEVRREGFVIDQAKTAQQSRDNTRMVDALLLQASSSATLARAHDALAATLADKLDKLSAKLDTAKLDELSNKLIAIAEWCERHERVAVEPIDDPTSQRHRRAQAQTPALGRGFRRSSTHNDD